MDEKLKEFSKETQREAKRQMELIQSGCVEITPAHEFELMLCDSLENNRPLRVKCGIDPNIQDVHIGHLVPYRKMRLFQDLGHQGVVIIGDYTASIGDPSGKNEARPAMDIKDVQKNALAYMEQLYFVLDKDKTEVRYQSEWFEKAGLTEILTWAAQTTVAKLLSHETFKVRLEKNLPLALHELFYPVLQGIDSVFIDADVELGGSDQLFNVLMGRDYQKARGQRPQVAILLPLIMGICGTQKMSKSLGNFISILDEPFDKFGKVMSIPDPLMKDYYQFVLGTPESELADLDKGLKDGSLHPNEVKKTLASRLVGLFHGEQIGNEMREQFERVFKQKKIPDDVPRFSISEDVLLVTAFLEAGLVSSKGELRRLIKQNAVSFVDGEKITDPEFTLNKDHQGLVVKAGKRKFLKLD